MQHPRDNARPNHRARIAATIACATTTLALTACQTTSLTDPNTPSNNPPDTPIHAIHDGTTTQQLQWNELLSRIEHAEVVILGEQHDDARGHAIQQSIAHWTLTQLPGRTAVSLEMLERHEQPLVDAYLEGDLDIDSFIVETESSNWGGEGKWEEFYHPVIDVARANHQPVIAANAPRSYVRAARTDGYEHLRKLPAYTDEQLYEFPLTIDEQSNYRTRFFSLMNAPLKPDPPAETGDAPPSDAQSDAAGANPHADGMTHEQGMAIFRSQMVWDATMASSILDALHRDDVDRVVHLVGQFHADFQGGTVREILARAPGTRVLTISLVPGAPDALAPEDRDRAEIVIYTGLDEAN